MPFGTHSREGGDPAAHGRRGELTWAFNGLVCPMGCWGQYEVGPDGRLCLMLYLTGEYPLRPVPWCIHPLQAFQGIGPIDILLGCGWLSSLECITVLQPGELHTLWIESLHVASNCYQVRGHWSLRYCHCRGNWHSQRKQTIILGSLQWEPESSLRMRSSSQGLSKRRVYIWVNRCMHKEMHDEWIRVCMHEGMHAWIDEWMDTWMDAWKNEWEKWKPS